MGRGAGRREEASQSPEGDRSRVLSNRQREETRVSGFFLTGQGTQGAQARFGRPLEWRAEEVVSGRKAEGDRPRDRTMTESSHGSDSRY